MSNMSDKLSASVRRAKAQGEGTAKPAETAATPTPTRKTSKSRASAKPRTATKASAPRISNAQKAAVAATVTEAAPTESHSELFPERVWPD